MLFLFNGVSPLNPFCCPWVALTHFLIISISKCWVSFNQNISNQKEQCVYVAYNDHFTTHKRHNKKATKRYNQNVEKSLTNTSSCVLPFLGTQKYNVSVTKFSVIQSCTISSHIPVFYLQPCFFN